MKKKFFNRILFTTVIAFALLFTFGCGSDSGVSVHDDSSGGGTGNNGTTDNRYTVYLITMDQGSNFWKQIDEGCRKAVEEIGGINYKWIAPHDHNSKEQGECVDKAVADKADAIVISAISPTDINENLKKADEAGVKIVYVDSAATYKGIITLMTDSEKAGRVAGETMLKALKEKNIDSGTLGLYSISKTQNAILRENGFKSAFTGTNFTVAPVIFSDSTRQNIKNDVKAHPEYVGFFGTNGQMSQVISEQVKESGTGQLIIGFDTADFTLNMVKDGVIYATLQQNPKKMGHDGIEYAVKALKGEFKEKDVREDMGVKVLKREDI